MNNSGTSTLEELLEEKITKLKEAAALSAEVEVLRQDRQQKEAAITLHSQQAGVSREEAARTVEAYLVQHPGTI